MSRCLVTGGAGFIGSHVVEQLLEAGHQVYVLDNLSTGKIENLNHLLKDIHFIQGDILDTREAMNGYKNIKYVFHLAALARIQPSIDDPVTSHEVNVDGTIEVLEYCRQSGAKLIFSSSSSIYGGNKDRIDEKSVKSPKNPYALQKLICEQYINLYRQLYGLDAATLRYFNVYGERQVTEGAYAAVVGIFLDQKANGQKLTLTSDGEQRRDFTYVKDVARANALAMDWHGVFNIGSGTNYSINDIADFVGGEKEYIGSRKGEARITLANNNKARELGWAPSVDIKDWINENHR